MIDSVEKVLQRTVNRLPTWIPGIANVPILAYHYIAQNPDSEDKVREALCVPPDAFAAQMAYLSDHNYTTITLNELFRIFRKEVARPAKPIVLTFDDGYADFYMNAYPVLCRYNLQAISFIIAGLVGQEKYLLWQQIQEMQASQHVTFEAHTMTHPHLTTLYGPELYNELRASKHIIEERVQCSVNFISYPYGATNVAVMRAAKQTGFTGGVGSWYGKASWSSMNMPRVRVTGQTTLQTFVRTLVAR